MSKRIKVIALLCAAGAAVVTLPARALDRETRTQIMHGVVCLLAFEKDSDGNFTPVGRGSGTVITASGTILTNYHVIADSKTGKFHSAIAVGFTSAFDRAPEPACLAVPAHGRSSAKLDLAVIQCERDMRGAPLPPGQTYPAVPIGDSSKLVPGDDVFVIGYPGIGGTTINFTAGKISGFIGERNAAGRDWIKTDADIAGGNSGGAAIDEAGALVGVPTRIGDIEKRAEFQIGQVNYLRPIAKLQELLGATAVAVTPPPPPTGETPAAEPPAGPDPVSGDTPVQPPPLPVLPPEKPAATGVIVEGRVLAADNRRPIAGALVVFLKPGVRLAGVTEENLDELHHTRATTDTHGAFVSEIPLARGQSYAVIVGARGFQLVGDDEGVTPPASGPPRIDLGTIKLRRR